MAVETLAAPDLPRSSAARPGAGLTPERVAPLLTRSDAPFGRFAHVGPIAGMSATPPSRRGRPCHSARIRPRGPRLDVPG